MIAAAVAPCAKSMPCFSLLRSNYYYAYGSLRAVQKTFTFTLNSIPSPPSLLLHSHRSLSSIRATNNEEAAAKVAAANANTGAPTIFDKIIAKEIPATIVYEDEKVLAFRDINPQAPVHILIIPKFHDGLTQLSKAEPKHEEILGYLLYTAKIVAEKEGILDGFRVVINNGPTACQSVYHLHLHLLGGRQFTWPAG